MVVAGMPAAMIAGAASTYLLEVAPSALTALLRAEGMEVADSDEADRMRALREMSAAGLVRPMARAMRQRIAEDEGAGGLAALHCALAAWRGYRGYDHAALHLDAEYAREGYIYC